MKLTFPDGATRDFPVGSTPKDAALAISAGLARMAVVAKVNGQLWDMFRPITGDATIQLFTLKDPEGIEVLRHSCAHLLAHAVQRLHPKALPTIGPVIEHGFYYDFDNLAIKEDDLPKIEAEMKKIAKEAHAVERVDHKDKKEALARYSKNKYKVELINEFEEGLSTYIQGDFEDLCRGPHLPSTKLFEAFKLQKLAGAYWRGDAKNAQLTRIYGICFPKKGELKEHLELLEQAEQRDHRKLGKEHDLVMFHEYSPGSPFFLPKGTIIYNELLRFIREEYWKRGYREVVTPLVYDKQLWETSGHWEHFQEDMFILEVDGREFALKPMNCPSHLLMYMNTSKSYRDLPLRIADFAPLHRNEVRGALGGLTRVRKFSQDDSHTFCTEEQMGEEITGLLDFVKFIYADTFNFDYTVHLSTKPEKAMGSDELWEKAESTLQHCLEATKQPFEVNEGDGAFYGPKIDVRIKDAMQREWQLATIQLDFQMPARFSATYEGADGKKHTPIMIHKAILGALERFLAIMIEHYAGKFPLWLAPEQVRILTIADRHAAYAEDVRSSFHTAGLRATVDSRAESTSKKIREAQLAQVNYILVVGDKEMGEQLVNVRTRDNKVHGSKKYQELLKELLQEVATRG